MQSTFWHGECYDNCHVARYLSLFRCQFRSVVIFYVLLAIEWKEACKSFPRSSEYNLFDSARLSPIKMYSMFWLFRRPPHTHTNTICHNPNYAECFWRDLAIDIWWIIISYSEQLSAIVNSLSMFILSSFPTLLRCVDCLCISQFVVQLVLTSSICLVCFVLMIFSFIRKLIYFSIFRFVQLYACNCKARSFIETGPCLSSSAIRNWK